MLFANRSGERGFTLVEALYSIALLSAAALGIGAAVVGVTHALTGGLARVQLAGVAQNVLTDLRAAGAYQQPVLAALASGGARTFEIRQPLPNGGSGVYSVTETVTATGVPQPAPGAPATDAMPTYTAIVTVSDAAGDSQTFSSLLAEEAPAPGSQVTPDPSQTYSPPPSGPTNGPGPGSGPGSDGGYGGHGCAINPVACPRPIRGPIPL